MIVIELSLINIFNINKILFNMATLQASTFQEDLAKRFANREDLVREQCERILLGEDEKQKAILNEFPGAENVNINSEADLRKELDREVNQIINGVYETIKNGDVLKEIEEFVEDVDSSSRKVENCGQLGELLKESSSNIPVKMNYLLKSVGAGAAAGATLAIGFSVFTFFASSGGSTAGFFGSSPLIATTLLLTAYSRASLKKAIGFDPMKRVTQELEKLWEKITSLL